MPASRGDLSKVVVTESKEGARLRLRVKPGAKRTALEGEHAGALRVAVAAPPEKGRANEEVEALLARTLSVARGAVRIASGHASRDKTVVVEGLSAEEIRRRIALHGADRPL